MRRPPRPGAAGDRCGAARELRIWFSNSDPIVIARSVATKQSSAPREALDCFASLAMTDKHTSAFSRHHLPEFCKNISPWNEEGTCDLQEKAQGMPGVQSTH